MKFIPAIGLKNRHLQTMWASFFRKKPKPKLVHNKFILKDGDFLDISWCHIKHRYDNTPIVVLFHGLTGSCRSHYIRGAMSALSEAGYTSVVMHFRGCYDRTNDLPRAYHSGETNDAKEFIASLKAQYPKAPLYAVGYSLGGNMLLKLLGEMQEQSPFKAAVSVSAPMQLDVCANVMNTGFSRYYQKNLLKSLKKSLAAKYMKHDMVSLLKFEQKDLDTLTDFWKYDTVYTAPIHGFSSAQDYYTQSSSKQYLKNIDTPTLIIHASDDPFMNDSVLPNKSEISLSVELEVSANGGHVGFISGSIFSPVYWLDKKIISFFSS